MLGIKNGIFFCVTVTLTNVVISGKRLDNTCRIESTGELGVCTTLDNCNDLHSQILNNPIYSYSNNCGFQEKEKMICCAMNKENVLQRIRRETKQDREPGAISKAKCREYSRYVYERQKQPILLIDAPDIKKNQCGHRVVKLIIGGEPAQTKEFPHMVIIGYEPTPGDVQWFGGGTIISDRYILTAAHCLKSRSFGDAKYVKMGIINLNGKNDRKQEIKVSERIAHPEYNADSHYHDIGLMKLEKAIRMNSYARPACLYASSNVKARLALATGWGHTSFEGELSDNLLKVALNLIDFNTCNNTKGFKNEKKLGKGILNEMQLCAGSSNSSEEKDTCQGDSGGPLQIYHTGDNIECMYDIIGVTSFGKACGGPNPGVYVRVSNYVKWIEDIVWPS